MNKETVLITVAVPVYHVETYLSKCIESILGQTYSKLEILLIDDGSDDGCPAICDAYAEKDARIRVIHQQNKGRSGARNTGLKEAKGEYLLFVDGDDWIDDNCVETLYQEAITHNVQLVVGRYREIYEDKVIDGSTGEKLILKGQEPLEFYVRGHKAYQNVNSVCVKLYAKSLVEGIEFVEGKYYEDIMFVTQVYAKCNSCVYLDEAFYNYNIGTASSITFTGVNELTFRDEIPCFYEKEQFLQEKGRLDLARTYAFFRYERLLTYYRDCFVCKTKENKAYAKRIRNIICGDRKQITDLCHDGEGSFWERLGIRIFLVNGTLYRGYFGLMKWYGERKNKKNEDVA